MKRMFLLSVSVHFVFLALMAYLPEMGHKQMVYTPVYTVDLLTLPKPEPLPPQKLKKTIPPPKKKPKLKSAPPPQKKRKPLEFSPPSMDEKILQQLENFEKKIGRREKIKKKTKKIREMSLSEMLTNYEKKWEKDKDVESPEELPAEGKEQEDILKKLEMLEEKWARRSAEQKEEDEKVAAQPVEEVASEKIEKQIQLRQAKVESQTSAPIVPSYLNRYYALILSRIHENWLNPLSSKLEESELKIPGVAYFEIQANGEISNVRIEEPSGNELLDALIKKAISDTSPLPPPPRQFAAGRMDVFLDFRYILEK